MFDRLELLFFRSYLCQNKTTNFLTLNFYIMKNKLFTLAKELILIISMIFLLVFCLSSCGSTLPTQKGNYKGCFTSYNQYNKIK